MKPGRAIAILTVPLALLCVLSFGAMCLTPYRDCRLEALGDLGEMWKPALITLAILLVVAALVLYLDLVLIRRVIPRSAPQRKLLIAMCGAVIATLPRILLAVVGGQGMQALSPQIEYLPFVVVGAVFALLLDRMTRIDSGRHPGP
jgi:hypothetical protein